MEIEYLNMKIQGSEEIQSFLHLSAHSVKYFKSFVLTYNIYCQQATFLDIDSERSFRISNHEGNDGWLDGCLLDSHWHPAAPKGRKHVWNVDGKWKLWQEELHTSGDY